MKIIVTTGQKCGAAEEKRARAYAAELRCEFVGRAKKPLDALKKLHCADVVVVADKNGVRAHDGGGELFFHLSMAQLRLKNIQGGKADNMVAAMSLTSGMTVLDCTLGMGTDAVVASFVSQKNVTAVESSPLISLIVREGMKFFRAEDEKIAAALKKITVVNADYAKFLKGLPDKSYDVVYLDPMFRRPIKESCHLLPLRELADMRPIAPSSIKEAVRVARRRVVVKEINGSAEFWRLGIKNITGGKYSSVAYGVVEIEQK